jgi:hypothetical protein
VKRANLCLSDSKLISVAIWREAGKPLFTSQSNKPPNRVSPVKLDLHADKKLCHWDSPPLQNSHFNIILSSLSVSQPAASHIQYIYIVSSPRCVIHPVAPIRTSAALTMKQAATWNIYCTNNCAHVCYFTFQEPGVSFHQALACCNAVLSLLSQNWTIRNIKLPTQNCIQHQNYSGYG